MKVMLNFISNVPLWFFALMIVISFLTGIIFKKALLSKHKKRVLQLEDEMLANHSRILSLEKRNADLSRLTKGNMPEIKILERTSQN